MQYIKTLHSDLLQESLANAKVSAQQQCVYESPYRRNLQPINTRNMLKSTFSGLQFCRYLHLFSRCCLPNLRNAAKFSENSNL